MTSVQQPIFREIWWIKIKFLNFKKVKHANKNGKVSDKPKPVSDDASTKFIIYFISALFAKTSHQRIHLKHCWIVLPILKENFSVRLMDVDNDFYSC